MIMKDMMPAFELYQPTQVADAVTLLNRFGKDGWKLVWDETSHAENRSNGQFHDFASTPVYLMHRKLSGRVRWIEDQGVAEVKSRHVRHDFASTRFGCAGAFISILGVS